MKVALDVNRMKTESEAHEYLKEMLQFPEYYGKNLDALYDCLTDYNELEVGFCNYEAGSDHIRKIRRVMEDAGVDITDI